MLGAKKEKTTTAAGRVNIPSDGRVHATVYQMSITQLGEAWGRGNALDAHLLDMQDAGAEILSAVPYVSNDGKTVKVLILFKAPFNSYSL